MTKTREQLLDEMLEREAIKDLPGRYCHYVWPLHEIKGQADLRKFYASEPDRVGARPFIHNIVIELKGPTRASGYAYLELRSAAQQMKWMGTGYYEDEYEKVGDQWKFKSRRFKMVHSEM
jgi:hypothetical protein